MCGLVEGVGRTYLLTRGDWACTEESRDICGALGISQGTPTLAGSRVLCPAWQRAQGAHGCGRSRAFVGREALKRWCGYSADQPESGVAASRRCRGW